MRGTTRFVKGVTYERDVKAGNIPTERPPIHVLLSGKHFNGMEWVEL